MARWIKKLVRKTASRGEEKVLQSFELRCGCGSQLLGHRMETAQQVVCHDCGDPRFVLPNNIYPIPKRAKRKRSKRKNHSDGDAAVAGNSFAKRWALGAVNGIKSAAKSIFLWFWLQIVRVAKTIQKFFTPVRSIVSVVGLVICLTAWYSIQSGKYANAEKTFRASSAQAQRELEDGNLKEAAEKFLEADKALKILGIDDSAKRKVHQYSLETNALTRLSLSSLESIVAEASEAQREGKLEEWNQLSAKIHSEGWIILDTHLSNKNIHTDEEETLIHIPHLASDFKITIHVEIPEIRKLISSGTAKRVILAFQFQECFPQASEDPRWVIKTNPETSFLWCHGELLNRIGFEDGEWTGAEVIETVMKRQAEFLKVSIEETKTDEFEEESESQ